MALLLLLSNAVDAADPTANDATPMFDDAILSDKPVAYWRFEGGDGIAENIAPVGGKQHGFEGSAVGAVTFGQPGPRPGDYPDFRSDNKAVRFDGKSGYLRIEDIAGDAGKDSPLKFRKGDTITVEAWINLAAIGDQQQIYIVGKGRTDASGPKATNQNWSLRMRGVDGAAGISFLFRGERNRPDKDAESFRDWHRWTSDALIVPGSGARNWHHVAVSYTFGKGDSIRGYIDGQPVKGAWDMGGVTDAGPVVDDDAVWIGSSMGGSAGSTFRGSIDEVAVYRTAPSPERIATRFHSNFPTEKTGGSLALAEDVALLVDGNVQAFIHEGLADKFAWPDKLDKPAETFELMDFVLAGIPYKYSDRGVRIDRANPTMVRLAGKATVEAGEYRFLIRSLNGARLIIDGKVVASNRFINPNASGHERVPDLKEAIDKDLPELPTGHVEKVVTVKLDKGEHTFVYDLYLGGRNLRRETGQPFVAIAKGEGKWMTLSPGRNYMAASVGWSTVAADSSSWRTWPGGMAFDHATWDEAEFARREDIGGINYSRRRRAAEHVADYWKARHELARKLRAGKAPQVPPATPGYPSHNAIDQFLNVKLAAEGVKPGRLVDDLGFVRRLWLDVEGVNPTDHFARQFIGDPKKTIGENWRYYVAANRVDNWADHWVPYWQDVLAENPSLIKPTLNNTGPFRDWIYESFADNKPIDRFATELIRMEGSTTGGGPAGFAMASQNDVPMAAKAHVIAKAFLGIEMKCARCHDAPNHPYAQKDLFSMAAMLERKAIAVPKTSSVPGTPEHLKKMLIAVTLKPGEKVEPGWSLESLASSKLPPEVLSAAAAKDPREMLAAIITSPTNPRFAQVMVNRLWKRYMGHGLVEPVDDWEDAKPSHPELLNWLAHELMTHDYDLKHVAKLILSSHAYQREVGESPDAGGQVPPPEKRLFSHQVRRRLSAEQVVDSLFAAVGKDLGTEMLTFDQDGRRPPSEMLNFGVPKRAWQFVSLSNERDRPALALPMAQHVSDLLLAFGWRDNRPDPITQRDDAPHALQPLTLANGPIVNRIARLSDDSSLTEFAVSDACKSPEDFVRRVFRSFLTREPSAKELKSLADGLHDGFSDRVVKGAKPQAPRSYRTPVSWANHLSAEATTIKLELEKRSREGDPPTARLTKEWRERAEDVVWAVMNMPEFLFVP